jgi:hypothetical protein
MRRVLALACPLYLLPVALLAACGSDAPSAEKCNADSTIGVVQAIFETRGCTTSTCHGAPGAEAAGGLDLRPEGFYESLVNVAGESGPYARVFPGDEDSSLLYLKLAAKTLGTDLAELGIAGAAMPSIADQLTEEELEVVRAWIRGGAPRTGVVPEADGLLGCISSAGITANKIPPLPPPDADKGLQLYSGGWPLPAESENEVCFVTYYDYSDEIPEDVKIPCPEGYGGSERECFTYKSLLLAQDPQSHHSVLESYTPSAENAHEWDPHDPSWKNWTCLGGTKDGTSCDPKDATFCGERSVCATPPETSIGCVVYSNGPSDLGSFLGFFGQEATRKNILIAQEATFRDDLVEGVYGILPVAGYTVWNSHSFNLTRTDTTVEQYVNLEYARSGERRYQRRDMSILQNVFAMGTIEPFQSQEVCAVFTLPIGSRILTLTSHTHKYGRDFRVWYPPNEPCAAGPDCRAPDRDPDYRSFTYQDPLYQRFDESNALQLDSTDSQDRTYKYCAIFDNGATNPADVRRHSMRPPSQACVFAEYAMGFIGECGCQPEERACVGGSDEGLACGGDDSVCGGGGECDACPVWGGVTTEEEMFAILGSYYVIE